MFKNRVVNNLVFCFIILILILSAIGFVYYTVNRVSSSPNRHEESLERKLETLALNDEDTEIEAIGLIRDESYILYRVIDKDQTLYVVVPRLWNSTPAIVVVD